MNAGFAAIIGPPNVGKSTFLNKVLGIKIAITSDKPQTTRHRLLGVYNQPELQVVFLDTPGLHHAKSALNKRMVQTALAALQDVDAVLFMTDRSKAGLASSRELAPRLAASGKPVVMAINKIDQMARKQDLLPILNEVQGWGEWKAMVPISALKGDGCQQVIDELAGLLPEGPPIFPEDTVTDLSMRFLVGEIVREKVFRMSQQEVPYASAVTIDQYLEPTEDDGTTAISATIHVERTGQKAILIGKGGAMIKQIGIAARREMEKLIGGPVFLDLFVRVEPKWTRHQRGLDKLGY